jgi:hypothetical protein
MTLATQLVLRALLDEGAHEAYGVADLRGDWLA